MSAQSLTQAVETTCGPDPTFICREVLQRSNSEWLAELSDVLFAKPLTIAFVVVVAMAVNHFVRKAIGRFVGAMVGEQTTSRRLKRRLRGTTLGNRLPSAVLDTGSVSLRSAARAETLRLVLRSVASFVIWAIASITILGELGVNLGPLVAGAGLVGVAFGFGAQSMVKDFLAGIFILVEDQYGVGDIVDVGEASGTIESVSLRTTRLRDVNGTVWHVPNGQIVRVGNKSQQWARALLDVTVAYEADLDAAQQLIKEVADGLWRDPRWSGQVLEEPEVWGIEELGPDAVSIRLVVKTLPSRQFEIMRELRGRLKHALDAAGVDIPFPQRTIWVRHDPAGILTPTDSPDSTDATDAAGAPDAQPARKPTAKNATAKKAPAKKAPAKKAAARRS